MRPPAAFKLGVGVGWLPAEHFRNVPGNFPEYSSGESSEALVPDPADAFGGCFRRMLSVIIGILGVLRQTRFR